MTNERDHSIYKRASTLAISYGVGVGCDYAIGLSHGYEYSQAYQE